MIVKMVPSSLNFKSLVISSGAMQALKGQLSLESAVNELTKATGH